MTENTHAEALFSVKNLTVEYHSGDSIIHAVNDVSFSLQPGQTLGLVGETGAGKTTIAKASLRILPEHSVERVDGEVLFEGQDVLQMNDTELRALRGKKISMIFQDPMTALNPVKTVISQIAEGYKIHHNCSKAEANQRAIEMLEMVGIGADRAEEYPHQFSGGMKQRVVIALALACSPQLLIADEPTTALDVTIQAQILELMQRLQKETGMAILMITHDLGVVAQMCDQVIVMYAGSVCEKGSVEDIFYRPSHSYTRGLLRSVPSPEGGSEPLKPIPGTPIDLLNLPDGCPFSPRCEDAMKICLRRFCPWIPVGEDHGAACWVNVKNAFEKRGESSE